MRLGTRTCVTVPGARLRDRSRSLGVLLSGLLVTTTTGSAPNESIKFTEVMSAGASTITAFGIVVGGVLAYRRLLSGRTFRPRLAIDLTTALVGVAHTDGVQIDISLSNIGQSTIRFAREYRQQLRVVGIRKTAWDYASGDGAGIVEWSAGFFVDLDIFADEGVRPLISDTYDLPLGEELKPADVIRRSFLVPHFDGACAYLVLLTLQACTHIGPLQRRRHRNCAIDKRLFKFHARTIAAIAAKPSASQWRW